MYKINELQFSLVVLCESMLNHHQEELCRTNVRTQAFIEKVNLDQITNFEKHFKKYG